MTNIPIAGSNTNPSPSLPPQQSPQSPPLPPQPVSTPFQKRTVIIPLLGITLVVSTFALVWDWLHNHPRMGPTPSHTQSETASLTKTNTRIPDNQWLNNQYTNHFAGINCQDIPTTFATISGNDFGRDWQTTCWSERIWYEDHPEWCQNLYDQNSCYGWMAIKTGDTSLCEYAAGSGSTTFEHSLPPSEKTNAWKYQCIDTVAIRQQNPKLCDLIPFSQSQYKDVCVRNATEGQKQNTEYPHSPI